MSKIKLNLDYDIVNGKQISFTAPCGSANAECLVIKDVEYTIVDADGASVAGQSNLWKSGAMVSVIMDTVNSRAFVQNANTNSYIESGFAKKTDLQGIYLGSGEMPENCNVQIDPNGDALTIDDIADEIVDKISDVGAEHEGKFLRVVNGRATWTTVPSAEGGSF